MNKNMIILIGLIITWFCVVRMNNANEKNNEIQTTTDTTTDNENTADTQSLTVAQNAHYVQVSQRNAVNTKSPFENYDLAVYGNTYTS